MSARSVFLRRSYLFAIFLKGFNGGLEFVAGVIFAVAGAPRLYEWIIHLTAPELLNDPDNTTVHLIRSWFFDLMHVSKTFVILYLLLHGGIKVAIAVNLLRGKSWAFPVSLVILTGFIAYMSYELSHHWSWLLFALTIFDVFTVALVLEEWRNVKAAPPPVEKPAE
jgi:uncharacterized membrane protein